MREGYFENNGSKSERVRPLTTTFFHVKIAEIVINIVGCLLRESEIFQRGMLDRRLLLRNLAMLAM